MTLFDTQENSLLDSMFGSSSPATYDLALSTTTPNDDATNITEPSGGSYARFSITNDGTSWNAAASGSIDNKIAFEFPQATADWGIITWWVLYDGATPIIYGNLIPARTINNGDTLRVPVSGLTISAN